MEPARWTAPVEPQPRDAHAHGDQTGPPGTEHMIHTLFGAYAAHGQRRTTPPDHGRGRGRGEKMRRATLGCAAADLALVGFISSAMGGQRHHIRGHPASAFAHALGHQPGQEGIAVAFEGIEARRWPARWPSTVGPEGARSRCAQA